MKNDDSLLFLERFQCLGVLFLGCCWEQSAKASPLKSYRHSPPDGRADLTASAVLQRIRGGTPQRHTLRLASAATSARE
jgi:hypothetical protein